MTVWCASESACVTPVLVSMLILTFAVGGSMFHVFTSALSRDTVAQEAGLEGALCNFGPSGKAA